MAKLRSEGIACTFQPAEDETVDSVINIDNHPLNLHIQLTPYGYPYIFEVSRWTTASKTHIEGCSCKSISDVMDKVRKWI